MKVIGIGLNKTGTKTLAGYLCGWGMRHRSFEADSFQLYRAGRISELLDSMEGWDSFEDWPWPLIWREIDKRFADARFVLTVRSSPEVWYRSLCKMAVGIGPLVDYEEHIYGYAMPQGHREEHLAYYRMHNSAIRDHFRTRPGKLLEICWADPGAPESLASFLGRELPDTPPIHENRGIPIYGGDNVLLAHICQLAVRQYWRAKRGWRRIRPREKGNPSPSG